MKDTLEFRIGTEVISVVTDGETTAMVLSKFREGYDGFVVIPSTEGGKFVVKTSQVTSIIVKPEFESAISVC